MYHHRRRLLRPGECSSDSSLACSTATSLVSIPSRFSLWTNSHSSSTSSANSSSTKSRLRLPSCLSRQDSSTQSLATSFSPRRAITPDGFQPLIRSCESGRYLTLLEEDVELLYTTWHKIPDKLLWCQRLFLKLFSVRAQMKKVMGFEGLTPKELLEYPKFEKHCQRFLDFWEYLIDNLYRSVEEELELDCEHRAEKVVNKIRQVGYMHCQMPGVTFDAESWLVFKNIILESICWQQIDIRDRRHLCWSKFVTFVISEMKDAFNQGVRSRSHTF